MDQKPPARTGSDDEESLERETGKDDILRHLAPLTTDDDDGDCLRLAFAELGFDPDSSSPCPSGEEGDCAKPRREELLNRVIDALLSTAESFHNDEDATDFLFNHCDLLKENSEHVDTGTMRIGPNDDQGLATVGSFASPQRLRQSKDEADEDGGGPMHDALTEGAVQDHGLTSSFLNQPYEGLGSVIWDPAAASSDQQSLVECGTDPPIDTQDRAVAGNTEVGGFLREELAEFLPRHWNTRDEGEAKDKDEKLEDRYNEVRVRAKIDKINQQRPLMPKTLTPNASEASQPTESTPQTRQSANRPEKYNKEEDMTFPKRFLEPVKKDHPEVIRGNKKLAEALKHAKKKTEDFKIKTASDDSTNRQEQQQEKKGRGPYKCNLCGTMLKGAHNCRFVRIPRHALEQVKDYIPDLPDEWQAILDTYRKIDRIRTERKSEKSDTETMASDTSKAEATDPTAEEAEEGTDSALPEMDTKESSTAPPPIASILMAAVGGGEADDLTERSEDVFQTEEISDATPTIASIQMDAMVDAASDQINDHSDEESEGSSSKRRRMS